MKLISTAALVVFLIAITAAAVLTKRIQILKDQLAATERIIIDLGDQLDASLNLSRVYRQRLDDLSAAHSHARKEIQRIEEQHGKAQHQLIKLHAHPEYHAWSATPLPDDADLWLHQLIQPTQTTDHYQSTTVDPHRTDNPNPKPGDSNPNSEK